MQVVRPVEYGDLDQLVALGELSAPGPGGAHCMPVGRVALEQAVAASLSAFDTNVTEAGDQTYWFVLADSDGGKIAGCASLTALAGARATYFAFRRDVLRQASVDLSMSHDMPALTMGSDLSRHSHLGACYVRPGTAAEAVSLLARARLLYAASAPHRFGGHFFATLPGYSDGPRVPFWDAVGAHFFGMPIAQADALLGATRNHPAMVEMMPHYPIYLDLLPADAQEALGRCQPAAASVRDALMHEGFEGGRYAGLLDGGALLHARREQLRSFGAERRDVGAIAAAAGSASHIVASGRGAGFRALLAGPGDRPCASLNAQHKRALALDSGEQVVCLEL